MNERARPSRIDRLIELFTQSIVDPELRATATAILAVPNERLGFARWAVSETSMSLAQALAPASDEEMAAVEQRWKLLLPALRVHTPQLFGQRVA
jgi:hypothetical protein